MQYFNPALLRKRAAGYEEAVQTVRDTEQKIKDAQELVRNLNAQADSRQNDQFQPFDNLSDNYDISKAFDDVSDWWNGENDKASAAGNRALTYFTPRLVGSLGLAAVVSLLAGRKGGIMPALIGAVAGWFLGGPAMDFFQKTFGSKPEDVKKRTDDAKKENGTNGANGGGTGNTEGGNTEGGKSGQQPPKQPPQQPPKQPQQNPPQQPTPQPEQPAEDPQEQELEELAEEIQQPPQQPPQQPQPTPQPEQPAEDPQEPTDEEELIREQGGEIPTTGGNPVEDPGAYGLPEDDPGTAPTGTQTAAGTTSGNEVPAAAAAALQRAGEAADGVKRTGVKLTALARRQQAAPQQLQQPQMTAEEWQAQVRNRTRMPWEYKSPEMRYHEYAFDIPETRQEQPYSYLGGTLNQNELRQAYPDDMVREYATTGNPLNRHRKMDDLRQEMYSNDQRGLMSGRKPMGRPIQREIPAGDFTLQRSRTYADLIRQHNEQPKIGPYKQ